MLVNLTDRLPRDQRRLPVQRGLCATALPAGARAVPRLPQGAHRGKIARHRGPEPVGQRQRDQELRQGPGPIPQPGGALLPAGRTALERVDGVAQVLRVRMESARVGGDVGQTADRGRRGPGLQRRRAAGHANRSAGRGEQKYTCSKMYDLVCHN